MPVIVKTFFVDTETGDAQEAQGGQYIEQEEIERRRKPYATQPMMNAHANLATSHSAATRSLLRSGRICLMLTSFDCSISLPVCCTSATPYTTATADS